VAQIRYFSLYQCRLCNGDLAIYDTDTLCNSNFQKGSKVPNGYLSKQVAFNYPLIHPTYRTSGNYGFPMRMCDMRDDGYEEIL